VTAIFFPLAGGIGLFLLGMVLLSDGLKAFAGDALRSALIRFTGRPLKAFGSGLVATALVQSSSATTVTMIGFVSAGLLTFPQAIGVILGASLGTTSTGWIVSVLGLKISIGHYALPLVGIGAFMKLLARGRWRSLGMALAGFGLIFVGIATLQTAMEGFSSVFKLSELPSSGWLGRALVIMIGLGLTVVLQSSSAAVATTLTALHTASINLEQAALLVIGASIGTTVTGALAAIGASVSAKRTALALVLFNSATGLIAVGLLPLFLWAVHWARQRAVVDTDAVSLAAFHTSFVALGVLLFLPFAGRLAHWVERLLPDKGPVLTAHLDATLLNVPVVALEATRRSLQETAAELFEALRCSLGGESIQTADETRLIQVQQALEQSQEFFAKIPPVTDDQGVSELRVSLLHAFDHLVRLQGYGRPPRSVRRMLADSRLRAAVTRCRAMLAHAAAGLHDEAANDWLAGLERNARDLEQSSRSERPALLQRTASGEWHPLDALDVLDGMRWLSTIAYHTWRVGNYLGGTGKPEPTAERESWPA
jgi:phosphate:Na+ symporter